MAKNVTMPKWGLTMKEGKLSKWFKSENDTIEKGEPFFEVETEKITNAVEATAGGVVFQIVVPAGTTVPVGTIVAVVAEPGEQPERIEGFQAGELVEEAPAAAASATRGTSRSTSRSRSPCPCSNPSSSPPTTRGGSRPRPSRPSWRRNWLESR